MTDIIFNDKNNMPDQEQVIKALGKSAQFWIELEKHVKETVGETTREYKYYSAKSGWILKTLYKKRNLFFMRPMDGTFQTSFVFGDRAVEKVLASDLPTQIKDDLAYAKKYAEGRGISFLVDNSSTLENIKKLLAIKLEK